MTVVVKGVSNVLTHVPDMIYYGSKPERELHKNAALRYQLKAHFQRFEKAVSYAPNQVYIGNMTPEALSAYKVPWHKHPLPSSQRYSKTGEIMPENEFYGLLKLYDEFDLVWLSEAFAKQVILQLKNHPLYQNADMKRLEESSHTAAEIEKEVNDKQAIFLWSGDDVVGCIRQGHEEDDNLTAHLLLENLSAKATGALAVRHLLASCQVEKKEIDYVINCGEEAVGDRYQRGGGNLGKAIAEACGCSSASGEDIKAFCCAPIHALVTAASLVEAGVFKRVIVVGGGASGKLGMKYAGHLKNDMPILEDILGSIAILIEKDDGINPVLRLDSVGKHSVAAGSSPQAITEALVAEPLKRLGFSLKDVDKYAVELHNPEVTEPQGSGNVPRTNYRMIAALGVMRGELERDEMNTFESVYGMPGFSPTQGHIAAAVPYMLHTRNSMMNGQAQRTMFIAKGSLFLGKMTGLSDGLSVLVEKNPQFKSSEGR